MKLKATTRTPQYLKLRSRHHLAQRLGFRLRILEDVARYVDLHYNPTRMQAKKDSVGFREIDAPKPLLKRIQRQIHIELFAPLWLPDAIHGYRTRRSVVSATANHAGQMFWWRADIRNFYPSITANRIYRMMILLRCSPDVARLLTRLCSRSFRLPQGAPTSPALANLYLRLRGVAARFDGLALKHGLNISFFGDDILVSSAHPFMGLQPVLETILKSAGLRLHPKKTGLVLGPDQAHEALGVVMSSVGMAVDVPRSYRRHLRSLLHLCHRYGPHALKMRGITTKDPKAFLAGKIGWAVHVNPKNRRLYAELDKIAW